MGIVWADVIQGPGLLALEEIGEDASVRHAPPVAEGCVEGGAHVAYLHELMPYPTALQSGLIVVQEEGALCSQ